MENKEIPCFLYTETSKMLVKETYSEPCQKSKMERFAKIVND